MAILLKADGSSTPLPDIKFETFQTAVDGYIELATLPDGRYMLMDEDGKMKKKPINTKATELLNRGTPVVGDVVICENHEMQ